jgi:hypothetical protein
MPRLIACLRILLHFPEVYVYCILYIRVNIGTKALGEALDEFLVYLPVEEYGQMMLCAKAFFCKFEVVVNLVGVLLQGPLGRYRPHATCYF